MLCLVKIMDKQRLNNILSAFFFKPKKIIFLHDKRYSNKSDISGIKNVLKLKLPSSTVEFVEYDSRNIDSIIRTCTGVTHKNPICYFDITGAGEFSAIGAYLACQKTFTPIFKLDIYSQKLINVYGCNSLEHMYKMPEITIDTVFTLNNASVIGHQRIEPEKEMFTNILDYCRCIFNNIESWKKLCFFLQTACAREGNETAYNFFLSKKTILSQNEKIIFSEGELLKSAERLKLITHLNLEGDTVSFYFKDEKIKKYMTDFGVWLELFCYISLRNCKDFHDVRMSTKINWEPKRTYFMEITNEIDVTFMAGIRPYFISCKLSEPASDALQEISVYPSYFGGEDSKCALVVLETINKEKSYIYKRAHDMGICIIDGKDIKNGKFIEYIKNSTKF